MRFAYGLVLQALTFRVDLRVRGVDQVVVGGRGGSGGEVGAVVL